MGDYLKVPNGPEQASNKRIYQSTCAGCGVAIGELHSRRCPAAICWVTRKWCKDCPHVRGILGSKDHCLLYPYMGALEPIISLKNQHYDGWDLDDFDFLPFFAHRRLIALKVNQVGSGAWEDIVSSPQAADLTDLTFDMPQLSLKTIDDCVSALQSSPLLARLKVLQFGRTEREWDLRLLDPELCEGEDTKGLIRVIERVPWLRKLFLAVMVPDPNRILAARFPQHLRKLLIRTDGPIDLIHVPGEGV